jgi:hypothetical protein
VPYPITFVDKLFMIVNHAVCKYKFSGNLDESFSEINFDTVDNQRVCTDCVGCQLICLMCQKIYILKYVKYKDK